MINLNGKKTYIVAALIIINALLFHFEILDVDTYLTVQSLLLGGTAYALRDGIKKLEK